MIPSGWYFCATSCEIKPGKMISRYFFNQKIILWRTLSGTLSVNTAICPHLGSDLSVLGKVQGEQLKCFSHDYTYNTAGDCVDTGFKVLPDCHHSVLKKFPVQEINGFVIVWYDAAGKFPSWTIPATAFPPHSNETLRSDFEFCVSLETLNEDNFDVGHLYKWHNVDDVRTTPVTVEGPTISIAHAFKRHSIVFGKPLPKPFDFLTHEINSQYSSTLYGHGLTDSFIDIYNLNIRLHDSIWCTPITATKTKYTTFLRLVPPPHQKKNLSSKNI